MLSYILHFLDCSILQDRSIRHGHYRRQADGKLLRCLDVDVSSERAAIFKRRGINVQRIVVRLSLYVQPMSFEAHCILKETIFSWNWLMTMSNCEGGTAFFELRPTESRNYHCKRADMPT